MESLRSREWLRLGLTASGIALTALLGYRLWSGPGNPSRYLGAVKVQKAQLAKMGTALARLHPGPTRDGRLVNTSREDATVVFDSATPQVTAVSVLLLNAAALTPDHTLKWQKLGYRSAALPVKVSDVRCEQLVRGDEQVYQLSYYLNTDSRSVDYDALNRRLLADNLAGVRRPGWVARVDARLATTCNDTAELTRFTGAFDRDMQQFLRESTQILFK